MEVIGLSEVQQHQICKHGVCVWRSSGDAPPTEVKGDVISDSAADAMYCELKWLTRKPAKGQPLKCMTVEQIKHVTQRNFFWARTMKSPFLNKVEAAHLLTELTKVLA